MGNFKIVSNNIFLRYCTLRSTIEYPNIFLKKLNNSFFVCPVGREANISGHPVFREGNARTNLLAYITC